jgi:hypothetical protein
MDISFSLKRASSVQYKYEMQAAARTTGHRLEY